MLTNVTKVIQSIANLKGDVPREVPDKFIQIMGPFMQTQLQGMEFFVRQLLVF